MDDASLMPQPASGKTIRHKIAADRLGISVEAVKLAQYEKRLPRPLTVEAVEAFIPLKRDRQKLYPRARYHLIRHRTRPVGFDSYAWTLLTLYAIDDIPIWRLRTITNHAKDSHLHDYLTKWTNILARTEK
jgi:hypothetical protein